MMRSRPHDDAMAELYRNDPAFALEVVNGMQPAEQVGGLAILAREFGMLASVGCDFHAPGDWSELGMYRPLPEDLSPLWERFDHARATTA